MTNVLNHPVVINKEVAVGVWLGLANLLQCYNTETDTILSSSGKWPFGLVTGIPQSYMCSMCEISWSWIHTWMLARPSVFLFFFNAKWWAIAFPFRLKCHCLAINALQHASGNWFVHIWLQLQQRSSGLHCLKSEWIIGRDVTQYNHNFLKCLKIS